ncbi:MAG: steroid Delta-isomerase [Mycobacterium sp.]|nr:steroid Delta-isomerase [Mycobacterium sp.]
MAQSEQLPERITETVNRYLECAGKGTVDDIVELYTPDATVEDPVGGEVHIGREAIRGFYSELAGGGQFEAEVVTLRALGHEAAFFWRLTMKMGDGGIRIEIISVMTFDSDAKITSMKAYWTPENITPL